MMAHRTVRVIARWSANIFGLLVVATIYNPQFEARRIWAIAFLALWFTLVEIAVVCAEVNTRNGTRSGLGRPIGFAFVVIGMLVAGFAIEKMANAFWRPVTAVWHDENGIEYQSPRRPGESIEMQMRRAVGDATAGLTKDR